MENNGMRPTMRLKWFETRTGKSAIMVFNSDKDYLILRQWWEDDNGKGEWRDIELEI